MGEPFRYISLGAGVQSSTVLAMSVLGLHGCPRAVVAIFADTQDEPQWVYDHLEKLKVWSPIPIHVVTQGQLSESVIDRHREGGRKRFAAIPAFTVGTDGRSTMLRRQCTREYKIQPIEREVRRLMGYAKGQRVRKGDRADALIGISLDEAVRMKPSRTPWVSNCYPLVDAKLRRSDCIRLLESLGLPVPEKSACVFCPFHDDHYWRNLKDNHPAEFERAAVFDEQVRNMTRSGVERPVYLHRSLKALRDATFDRAGDPRQIEIGFGNECEGMCGV